MSALSGFDSLKIIKKIPNATAFGIFGGDEGKVRNAHTCSLTGRFATVPNSHLTSEKQSPGLFFLTPSALSGFDSLKIKKIPNATAFGIFGGDEGNRTPDLLHAKQALSQLSYTPKDFIKTVYHFLSQKSSEIIKKFIEIPRQIWYNRNKIMIKLQKTAAEWRLL